jgi:hypothetical protein
MLLPAGTRIPPPWWKKQEKGPESRPQSRELEPGESITGVVLQLPAPGVPNGRSVILGTDEPALVKLPASPKVGHTVLAKELEKVRVGDRVRITFFGWRVSSNGRAYRDYSVVPA